MAWAAPLLERPTFEREGGRLRLVASEPLPPPIVEQTDNAWRVTFRGARWGRGPFHMTLAASWLRRLALADGAGGVVLELEGSGSAPLRWEPAFGGRGGYLVQDAAVPAAARPAPQPAVVEPVLAPMPTFAPLRPAPAPAALPTDDGGPNWPVAPRAGQKPAGGGSWREGKAWATVPERPSALSRPDPWAVSTPAPTPVPVSMPAGFTVGASVGAGYAARGGTAGGFGTGLRLTGVGPELWGFEPRLSAQGLWLASSGGGAIEGLGSLEALKSARLGAVLASAGLGYGLRAGTGLSPEHGPEAVAGAAVAIAPGVNAVLAWRLSPLWLSGRTLGWAQGAEVGMRFGSAAAYGGVGLAMWGAAGYDGTPRGLRWLPEVSAAWRF